MRAYLIIALLAGGVGILVGQGHGAACGFGAAMIVAGVLEVFHRCFDGLFN